MDRLPGVCLYHSSLLMAQLKVQCPCAWYYTSAIKLYTLQIAQTDYVSIDETVTFQPATSTSPVCVNISIMDDSTLESDEVFTVRLTSSDVDVVIGSIQEANVTISDNDGKMIINLLYNVIVTFIHIL